MGFLVGHNYNAYYCVFILNSSFIRPRPLGEMVSFNGSYRALEAFLTVCCNLTNMISL